MITIKLFRLFRILIDKFKDGRVVTFLSKTPEFYDVLFYAILSPSSVGFNINNNLQLQQMYEETGNLSKQLVQFLDLELLTKPAIAMLRKPEFNLLAHLNPKTKGYSVQESSCLVDGYQQLNECELLLLNTDLSKFALQVLTIIFDNAQNYSPSQRLVAEKALKLAFHLQVPASTLMTYLTVTFFFCYLFLSNFETNEICKRMKHL